MGEIVEHSEDASPLLAEAARGLRPAGVLALTTPFGLSRHHDHYATFYGDSLVRLLAPISPSRASTSSTGTSGCAGGRERPAHDQPRTQGPTGGDQPSGSGGRQRIAVVSPRKVPWPAAYAMRIV